MTGLQLTAVQHECGRPSNGDKPEDKVVSSQAKLALTVGCRTDRTQSPLFCAVAGTGTPRTIYGYRHA